MATIYRSDKKTLGEFLAMTSPPLVVPEWQRSYSWTPSEVEMFWQDITGFSDEFPDKAINGREYFLGSVVIVEVDDRNLVLDGQQRLATATILLSVIRDFLQRFDNNAATRTSQKYISDFDDSSGENQYKLTLNRYDKDYFRRLIQTFPPNSEVDSSPAHASHKLIRRASELFRKMFDKKYNELGDGKQAFEWSLRVQRVLTNHLSVVAVTCTDPEDAANVFETLNDRGIGLSAPDLLRSFLLRKSAETARDEIIECWDSVLDIGEGSKVEAFLRHDWLSRNGDVKTRSLYREIRRSFPGLDQTPLEFSRSLEISSAVYRDLITAHDDNPELSRLLQGIKLLGAGVAYPLILSAYSVCEDIGKAAILKAVITLFVRYNVVSNLENNRLETILYSVAKDLRNGAEVVTAVQELKDFAPSDERFKSDFCTVEITRIGTARYLLRELEHAIRMTGELSVDLPDRVHVEHIYPKKPREGMRWEDHVLAVNRLGNLSLLSRRLNLEATNAPFEEKLEIYKNSDIALTRQLLNFSNWNLTHINERQVELAELASSIWKFE